MIPAGAAPPEIVVIGSANLDIVVPVDHHPRTGETVLGGDHRRVPGGKGANQATAAARLGRRVIFIGCVGDDDAGRTLRTSLDDAGVDTSLTAVLPDTPSGIAMIAVDRDGDNAIVVSPGANAALSPEHIGRHRDVIANAPTLLLQLETPIATISAAASMAGGTVILNPAPASALPRDLLDTVDVLVPNHIELAMLTGSDLGPTPDTDALVAAARSLPVDAVVVTLGERGALTVTKTAVDLVPAPTITPVDTTGAGDAFCAALADGLLSNDLLDAVAWAVRVGAATTLRPGAAPSLPDREEVAALLTRAP